MSETPETTPWQRFTDPERKRAFARNAYVRPNTPNGRYEAALMTFPDPGDETLAVRAAQEWPYDRVCIEEKERLDKEQGTDELPSRAQQARDIYNLAQDATRPVEDRLKAHKLYAEIMGHMQKPGADGGGGNTYIDNRRVILMPAPAPSIADWEAEAKEHQAKLVADASR